MPGRIRRIVWNTLRAATYRRPVRTVADCDERSLLDIGPLKENVEGALSDPWRGPSREPNVKCCRWRSIVVPDACR